MGNAGSGQKERKDHQWNVTHLVRKKKCFGELLVEYSTGNVIIDTHVEKHHGVPSLLREPEAL
jgi:hypothetical protein